MLTDDDRITLEAQEAANDLQNRVGSMTDEEIERALRVEVWSDLQAQVVHDEVRPRSRERRVREGAAQTDPNRKKAPPHDHGHRGEDLRR